MLLDDEAEAHTPQDHRHRPENFAPLDEEDGPEDAVPDHQQLGEEGPVEWDVVGPIGAYSVVDGLGVRSAGSPFSYIVWLEGLCGFPITAVVLREEQPSRGRAPVTIWYSMAPKA